MKCWTVGRTWWELTKLVARGLARYDLYLRVDDLPTAAQEEFDRGNWGAARIDWTDSRDHYVVLSADPESGVQPDRAGPGEADDRNAVVARLEEQLATERFISERLDTEVKRLLQANNALNFRFASALAEADRLRSESSFVAAERCECGGDTELHWRTRAVAAEAQAGRDRAAVLVLTDRLADAEGREVSAGYVR